MASTNQTTHYELSQYIGTDKPTYLVDYNGDMAKIDSGIYGAKSEADTNATSIGTLANLGTSEKTNLVGAINEVNTQTSANTTNIGTNTGNITTLSNNVGNLTNLNTTYKTNLVGAVNEVKGNVDNFNLTSFTSFDYQHITTSVGTLTTGASITVAKNSDGSLAKVYGNMIINGLSGQSTIKITIANSGLAPSSDFVINNAGMVRGTLANETYVPYSCNLEVKANGNLEINLNLFSYTAIAVYLWPCLYFVKDFGDVPLPE